MSISLVLADDHEIVRRGLRVLLESQADFTVVGEAADGVEVVRQIERYKPNVLVLDLMMPGLNGLEALPIVRQRAPDTQTVILSGYASESFVAEAFNHGALAYVLKGGKVSELFLAVRAAAKGQRFLSSPLSRQGLEAYLKEAEGGVIDPRETLTPREREVFQLAIEGHTCPQIANHLHISERTVEVHRAHIMHKLGMHTQTELVLYAVHRGLLV